MWYLYIIEAKSIIKRNYGNIKLYTGISQDPVKRYHEHKNWKRYYGKKGWFERTKRKPRKFVCIEHLYTNNKQEAEKYEKKVKRYSRKKKEKMGETFRGLYPKLNMQLEDMVKREVWKGIV